MRRSIREVKGARRMAIVIGLTIRNRATDPEMALNMGTGDQETGRPDARRGFQGSASRKTGAV